ncbi:ABC transporter permease [Clostridium tetanomorphum]|uniref:Transport permease protein n=1 Tax=Clostridium tetanomorphum TaxID=1553 RepID=A0A923EDJ2_CLOTT|nr:ABC transporter permease [Clostridium tetanomorphum]MBC2398675.1 ABC transporter permease [Clostridium tetanomorphum]NRZ97672.1 ABC-2 type transport system permease protein [Clostridium tetanomorphum]
MNILNVTKFDLINTIKNPVLLMFNTIYPLVITLLFGFIAKGTYGGEGVTSYDYYGVTIMIFTMLNMSLTTSNAFMEKKIVKGNIRLIYSPTSKSVIFLSKILATFIFGAITSIIILILENSIFKINFGGENFMYVVLIIVMFTLLMSSIGAFMCCIFKSEEAANKFLSPVNTLLALLGGLLFPVDSLGKTVEKLSYLSPVKWVSECIFKIIYDNDFSMFIPLIIICILGALLFIVLCQITFKPEEYV